MEVLTWIKDHYQDVISIIAGFMVVAGLIVRLTPTEKDDGVFATVDKYWNKLLDFLKVPNVKKK